MSFILIEDFLADELHSFRSHISSATAVIISKEQTAAKKIIGKSNKTLILGNRFKTLYKIKKELQINNTSTVIAEFKNRDYPIKKHSLDTLIIMGNQAFFLDKNLEEEYLKRVHHFLKPGGKLYFSYPVKTSILTKLVRLIKKQKLIPSHEFTRILISSGYKDAGQKIVHIKNGNPQLMTFATAI
jgi:hypothetical protein